MLQLTRRVVAWRDPALSARIVRSLPLHYGGGADPSVDRPAHVRAGSGVAWLRDRLVVVQDDANFIALVDPRDGSVNAIALPSDPDGVRQFDDTRGNKADKLDLEAVASIPQADGEPIVLAFGSGSTPHRESVVVLRGLRDGSELQREEPLAVVKSLPAFYARLRATESFAGSELNVEAAVYDAQPHAHQVRLFNRGNGAGRDDLAPVNATCEVAWDALSAHLAHPETTDPPPVLDIVQYDLGSIGGRALTFTDATAVPPRPDAARTPVVYTAAAEASPDAIRDGPVVGCAVGVIIDRAHAIEARWARLVDEAGQLFSGKVEGIALRPDDPTRGYVVVDRDAPDVASELCMLVLEGPWFAIEGEETIGSPIRGA